MDYVSTIVDGDMSLSSNLYVYNDQDTVDAYADGLDVFENDELNYNSGEVTVADSVNESPGGTKYFTPAVNNDIIPRVGHFFKSVEMAEQMYRKYAEHAGFDVRLSNRKINRHGQLTARWFVCSKQGSPPPKMIDSLDGNGRERRQRNSNVKRSGCGACLKIHYVKEKHGYEVYYFVESHNHVLFDGNEMSLSRARRGLIYEDYRNVYNASCTKIGIAKSHRMRNAMKGGVGISGGTVRDFQNVKRDMVTFIGNKDAQMLINTMVSRQKVCPEFFFEFRCNEKEMIDIFWADETMKMNYREFGDTISFDATYRTNLHAMVFVPFIGIDNHKKSVVVGAALMKGETVPDYTWVLKAFMKAHGREPKFVITDQCPAMKQAIPVVFPGSVHRLCMWHIIKNVKSRITVHLAKETNFIPDFKKLVWNMHMGPSEFEVRWKETFDKYGLSGDKWFRELFNIRESWIPAYFKDSAMSGLMRTTSRSESINAFFNVYAAFWDDLVFFLKSFDMAIESQRRSHCVEEVKTKMTVPRMVSPRRLEAHASKVYTRTIFFEFQKELSKSVWYCGVEDIEKVDDKKIYTITHKTKDSVVKAKYKVVKETVDGSLSCSCNKFVRDGILCRHSLKVLINDECDQIPEMYIMRRWRCDLIPPQWMSARVKYGEIDVEKERLMGSAFVMVERIMDRVRNDRSLLESFVALLTCWNDDLHDELPLKSAVDRKKETIQEILGVSVPDDPDFVAPTGIKNKGSGTGHRLKGAREKATEEAKKPKRLCRTCKDYVQHDSRNCPQRGI